jgi:hypothetical protein
MAEAIALFLTQVLKGSTLSITAVKAAATSGTSLIASQRASVVTTSNPEEGPNSEVSALYGINSIKILP